MYIVIQEKDGVPFVAYQVSHENIDVVQGIYETPYVTNALERFTRLLASTTPR